MTFLRSFVGFQPDNARRHTAMGIGETIGHFGKEKLPHPFFAPDLPTADFHLFGSFKEFLCRTKILSDDVVKNSMIK